MSYLANFLVTAFSAILSFFTSKTGKLGVNLALLATFVTFITGLTVAFFAAIYALVSTIQYSISNQYISLGISLFWTQHLNICLSVVISAHVARFTYIKTKEIARYTVEASMI